eukprot:16430550-Heterocapsa_arctica.AAC.1
MVWCCWRLVGLTFVYRALQGLRRNRWLRKWTCNVGMGLAFTRPSTIHMGICSRALASAFAPSSPIWLF